MSERVRNRADSGYRVNSGRYGPLEEWQHDDIRRLLRAKVATLRIAEEVGCSSKTVYRIRKENR